MLRGDDVENIYLIENHHEALGYWRNMHISNKTIIHIDSHHDLFEGTSFPWINNYLWFAIKENILKEIYLVYPKHIIENFDLVEKYVASIMGFVSLNKISHHMFSVTTTETNIEIYVCSFDKVVDLEDYILDIDLDYFIYNGLGCFIDNVDWYSLSSNFVSDLELIGNYISRKKPQITTISKSIFQSYVPAEYVFLYKIIMDFFDLNNLKKMDENRLIISSLICRTEIDVDNLMDALYDDLLYYNACLAIHKGGYKQAKYCFDKISNTNKMIFQQYSTGCRYHLFKGNINAAYQEAFKYKLFYEDSNTYVLAISYIEQFLGNFQNSIDILKNIDKPDERMLLLLAKAYMKIANIKNARVCVEQIILKLLPSLEKYQSEIIDPQNYQKRLIFKEAIKIQQNPLLAKN